MSSLTAFHASLLRGPVGTPPPQPGGGVVPPVTLAEDSPLLFVAGTGRTVTVANSVVGGAWATEVYEGYIGGQGAYCTVNGGGYEVLIQSPVTGCFFTPRGLVNGNGGDFNVLLDGVQVAAANCYAPSLALRDYCAPIFVPAGLRTLTTAKLTGNALYTDELEFALPTLPRLRYEARSLTPASAVNGWANEGRTGAAQSLTLGSSAPACLSGGPNGAHFLRFVGADWLTTPGLLGLSGADNITVAVVLRVATATNRNLFGWGTQDENHMFDVHTSGSQVALHNYGAGGALTDGGSSVPGAWQVLYLSNTATGLYPRLAGVEYSPTSQQVTTPGTLRVGAGQWPGLNNAATVDVAHFELFDGPALTAQQKTNVLIRIGQLYNLPA